jgi:isoleucyl-tRNA synthetase
MAEIFDRLTAWLAPILCFTAEEAWQSRVGDPENSVHLRSYDAVPAEWRNADVATRWSAIRKTRQVVMSALEAARNDGEIGSSLQAAPIVHISTDNAAIFADMDCAALFITSDAKVTDAQAPAGAFRMEGIDDVAVVFAKADGGKCARCWKILPDVTTDCGICGRCSDVVS